MNAAETVVRLSSVTKVYRIGDVEVRALQDISITVSKGEFVVILGPSGCGKTTLMNLIGGLDTPTSGEVWVAGSRIDSLALPELTRFRRESVSFVFQFFNLVNTLTARENIQLAAELVPNPLSTDAVLQAVGLADRADHFPSELSGGEQQRVSIARALVKHAPILLCDEPTGELDFETGRMILDLLHKSTHDRGQTVLMVTHNSGVAEMADRVLRLRSGKIISDEVNPHPQDPMSLTW